MKFQTTTPTRTTRTLTEIKTVLILEFKKSKLESQCITELKEIKQGANESVWDFDQRFKSLMDKIAFLIHAQQHKEWFIATLVPHIRMPFFQQRLAPQAKALEATIIMEASPIGESCVGMAQVQWQLDVLTLQLQDISKQKERRDGVWCTYCHTEGHFKKQCLVIMQYMATTAPNPIGPGEGVWCEICKTRGHQLENCHLLQKYVNLPRSLYCNFYQWVGHEQLGCRAWKMMHDRNASLYRV